MPTEIATVTVRSSSKFYSLAWPVLTLMCQFIPIQCCLALRCANSASSLWNSFPHLSHSNIWSASLWLFTAPSHAKHRSQMWQYEWPVDFWCWVRLWSKSNRLLQSRQQKLWRELQWLSSPRVVLKKRSQWRQKQWRVARSWSSSAFKLRKQREQSSQEAMI